MYMTVADLQKKLNNLLREIKSVDKNALVVDCSIVRSEHHVDIPNGSIVFKCINQQDEEGTWHELQIYPDPPSKLMQ